jgi:peptidoglycan/xylan/chitin deacetylase (PgdA/CDA1 family)
MNGGILMLKKILQFILSILIIYFYQINFSYAIEIAITVDDLPGGDQPKNVSRLAVAEEMLKIFKKHHIKNVYGMVNGNKIIDKQDGMLLQDWISDGNLLGNHTFSHLDLAKVSADEFISDIVKNEIMLSKLMHDKNYRYFRYPYLAEGNTQEKRNHVRQFLFDNHYKIAPVTVDFFDYEWNEPYMRCVNKGDQKSIEWLRKSYVEQSLVALKIAHELSMMLFKRDIKNILLIHINGLSVSALDDLLTEYEKQGMKFVDLSQALSDSVYKIDTNIVRDRSYTFLNQIRLSRHLKNPEIVNKLYSTLPEEKLEKICR